METSPAHLDAYRRSIAADGRGLGERAGRRPDATVPDCPGWDLGALLAHTGGAQRWATANLAGTGRVRSSTLPPAPARSELAGWYGQGLDALLAAATTTDPEATVWTFSATGETRAAWWLRRMAVETHLHHLDASRAEGSTGPPVADLEAIAAAEGIDEYLTDLLPRLPAQSWEGWRGTLHLHVTDTDGEWVLDLGDPSAPVRRSHARADTAVRGGASDLLRWLWNRGDPAHLEVIGDPAPVLRWRQIRV